MTKSEAVALLGGSSPFAVRIATVLMGYSGPSSIYNWPDELPAEVVDRVLGVASREGIKVPRSMMPPPMASGPDAETARQLLMLQQKAIRAGESES